MADRELGLVEQTLRNWVKAAEAGKLVGAGTKLVTPEQMELSRLRAANARLETHVDIPKKATAYFAKDALLSTPGSARSAANSPCQTIDALTMAWFRRESDAGVIFHSDRGSQRASQAMTTKFAEYGMTASTSRNGICWENAPTESFFNSLKNERVHGTTYST